MYTYHTLTIRIRVCILAILCCAGDSGNFSKATSLPNCTISNHPYQIIQLYHTK